MKGTYIIGDHRIRLERRTRQSSRWISCQSLTNPVEENVNQSPTRFYMEAFNTDLVWVCGTAHCVCIRLHDPPTQIKGSLCQTLCSHNMVLTSVLAQHGPHHQLWSFVCRNDRNASSYDSWCQTTTNPNQSKSRSLEIMKSLPTFCFVFLQLPPV